MPIMTLGSVVDLVITGLFFSKNNLMHKVHKRLAHSAAYTSQKGTYAKEQEESNQLNV